MNLLYTISLLYLPKQIDYEVRCRRTALIHQDDFSNYEDNRSDNEEDNLDDDNVENDYVDLIDNDMRENKCISSIRVIISSSDENELHQQIQIRRKKAKLNNDT
ncbi:hypothetical protein CEXT_486171 [Caerostris extrusa]|uniref:Uncharacterized protein n=1 Tax=Caerostris extrusa TaxID=172846 RepID=A0AAV4N575_CAEEX|nr:hypothetical protein CEXT_486171 [Caerostris extrusa]